MQIRLCACAFVKIEYCKPFMVATRVNFADDKNSSCLHETNLKA